MAAAQPKDSRNVMMTVVIVLLLTLIGAGVGIAVGALLEEGRETDAPARAAGAEQAPDSPEGNESEEQAASAGTAADEHKTEELKVMTIPPVLTTLADPKGKWIRLEGSILISAESETQPELLAEEAGQQILTYLRSVRLSQLDSASGILGLRDDLDETVMTLSKGQVRGVLIHGLVVE